MRIGERVHYLLKKYNKSQKELADFLNTKTSTINGWKQPNRNPSSEMIVPICKFFDISTDYFLNNDEISIDENNINHTIENKDMFNKDIFSERLIELRTKNKIMAKDIASKIGISKQAYSQYEKKQTNPSADILIALANYFNVSLDYLTGRTDEQVNPDISGGKLKLSGDETELLEDFRKLDGYEQNIIMGKISEIIYNKKIEKERMEASKEHKSISLKDRLNK